MYLAMYIITTQWAPKGLHFTFYNLTRPQSAQGTQCRVYHSCRKAGQKQISTERDCSVLQLTGEMLGLEVILCHNNHPEQIYFSINRNEIL